MKREKEMGEATEIKKEVVKKQSAKNAEQSFNMTEIRELAELVNQHGFTDFEFENASIKIRLSKTPAVQVVQAAPIAAQPAPVVQAAPTVEAKAETPHPGAKAEQSAAADDNLHKITSPIVGTFYRSPSPDKAPYVNVGDNVSSDSIVCIVEAMKLMNEIPAEISGEIVKIYVENGQPVEYGQPLFGIKK